MVKRAVVTGVSSGIGQAITQYLLNNGWEVIGISRRPPAEPMPNLQFHSVDLLDSHALALFLTTISEPIHAVIHAAGMMEAANLGELKLERSQQLWRLHVHTAEILANTLVHKLPKGGRIILLGSRTSKGVAGRSQYTSTKAALVAMARSWAMELITKGITVNVIAPGATETPMLVNPNRQSSTPKLPPIGRYIMPSEVAQYIGYLLLPAADAITGQEMIICGGSSL